MEIEITEWRIGGDGFDLEGEKGAERAGPECNPIAVLVGKRGSGRGAETDLQRLGLVPASFDPGARDVLVVRTGGGEVLGLLFDKREGHEVFPRRIFDVNEKGEGFLILL